jgi:DNA-binding response OmpR family regulator
MNNKILIVEDTPDLCEILTEFLEMQGFIVSACLTAKSAVEKLEQGFLPDLILTDLTMPDMDGFKLIEKIRESKSLNHIPIVIFSARPIQENEARASDLGVAKYIKKPCSPDDLVLSIEEILKDK